MLSCFFAAQTENTAPVIGYFCYAYVIFWNVVFLNLWNFISSLVTWSCQAPFGPEQITDLPETSAMLSGVILKCRCLLCKLFYLFFTKLWMCKLQNAKCGCSMLRSVTVQQQEGKEGWISTNGAERRVRGRWVVIKGTFRHNLAAWML